jgi:hypothetical protein
MSRRKEKPQWVGSHAGAKSVECATGYSPWPRYLSSNYRWITAPLVRYYLTSSWRAELGPGVPSDDPLRVSETMMHLLGSEDYPRAADYYANPSLDLAEVQGATRAIADAIAAPSKGTPADAAREFCRTLEVDDPLAAATAERFLYELGVAIEHCVPLEAA